MFKKRKGHLRCQNSIYSNISLYKKGTFHHKKGTFGALNHEPIALGLIHESEAAWPKTYL